MGEHLPLQQRRHAGQESDRRGVPRRGHPRGEREGGLHPAERMRSQQGRESLPDAHVQGSAHGRRSPAAGHERHGRSLDGERRRQVLCGQLFESGLDTCRGPVLGDGQADRRSGDRRPQPAVRGRLQVPGKIQGEGRRRRHRPLRSDVQALRLRLNEGLSDLRLCLSGPSGGGEQHLLEQGLHPHRQARPDRNDRDHGRQPRRTPEPLEVVPQLRLRQSARLWS